MATRVKIGVGRHDEQFTAASCTTCDMTQLGGLSGVNGKPNMINQLQPSTWHSRIPFYSTNVQANSFDAKGDLQSVVDQEIIYAAINGRVDHFTFNFWPIREPSFNSDGTSHWAYLLDSSLNKYLASPNRDLLKFALNVQLTTCDWSPTSGHSCVITQLVAKMQHPNYVRVLGNRPLLFIQRPAGGYAGNVCNTITLDGSGHLSGTTTFASLAALKTGTDALRTACQTGTGATGNPYIVAMGGGPADISGPTDSTVLTDVAAAVTAGVADAICVYVTNGPGSTYADLATNCASELSTYLATGKKLVPFVTCGWDATPSSEGGGPFARPTAAEWKAAVQRTVDFANSNPSQCETGTIHINSWSEFTEGGYLCPTLT